MPRPARMPKAVQIGPHAYTVLRRSPKMGSDENGKSDTDALELIVRQSLKRSKAKEILLHEIQHVIIWHALPRVVTFTEEQVVEATAPFWLQLIRENPELIDYLRS